MILILIKILLMNLKDNKIKEELKISILILRENLQVLISNNFTNRIKFKNKKKKFNQEKRPQDLMINQNLPKICFLKVNSHFKIKNQKISAKNLKTIVRNQRRVSRIFKKKMTVIKNPMCQLSKKKMKTLIVIYWNNNFVEKVK